MRKTKNQIYLEHQVLWAVQRRITAVLSMVFSGSYGQVLLGEIYPQITETGKTFTRGFADGEIVVFWEKLLEMMIDEPDYEWLMIDASHIKVHPHAAGAKGGNQDMSRTKGGSTQNYIWPWMRMVCRSESLLT